MNKLSLATITADELEAFLAHLAQDRVLTGCGDIEILWNHPDHPDAGTSFRSTSLPMAASISQLLADWLRERANART